jgi:hypothetical protein
MTSTAKESPAEAVRAWQWCALRPESAKGRAIHGQLARGVERKSASQLRSSIPAAIRSSSPIVSRRNSFSYNKLRTANGRGNSEGSQRLHRREARHADVWIYSSETKVSQLRPRQGRAEDNMRKARKVRGAQSAGCVVMCRVLSCSVTRTRMFIRRYMQFGGEGEDGLP